MHFEGTLYVEPDLATKYQTKSKFPKGAESQETFNVKEWVKVKTFAYNYSFN